MNYSRLKRYWRNRTRPVRFRRKCGSWHEIIAMFVARDEVRNDSSDDGKHGFVDIRVVRTHLLIVHPSHGGVVRVIRSPEAARQVATA